RIGINFTTIIPPKQTIFAPFGGFPAITDPVIIDGTVPIRNRNFTRVIEIRGGFDDFSAGLRLRPEASGSTIKGLILTGFTGNLSSAILIEGNNNTIQGNFIGTSNGNDPVNNEVGIRLAGTATNSPSNNLIGGVTATERNVISGNRFGILVHGGTGTGNAI